MNLSFTEEHAALRDMARGVFAKLYPASRLRELWQGEPRDPRAWRTMADAGLLGLCVPVDHGGSGGDAVDAMIVLEEAGRACVADPLVDTAMVGAATLAAAPGLGEGWLPLIASGEAVVAVQPADQPYVADADLADLLLVERDGSVFAVTKDGITTTAVPSEDRARRLFTVDTAGGDVAGSAGVVWLHGALGTAAVLNGIAGALLDRTLEYVAVRRQFGVAVGSFQAVKHKLASVFATLEASRGATLYAAYAVARGLDDAARAVAAAKVAAVDAESLANDEALQCHAGIGFTWEHDLHFWLKRGRALEHAYGSARIHRAALAAALLDT